MIIDTHTHLGGFGEKRDYDIKSLLFSMEKSSIDISLIIASYFGEKKHGAVSRGQSNRELITLTEKHNNLKVIGNVDYSKISAAHILEIKELILKKLIIGIKCYVGYEHYFPNNKKMHPLYDFCSNYGVPIIYHSGYLPLNSLGLLKFCHPLLVDEVAVRFPSLKIIVAHAGAPWIDDCIAVIEKNQNVYMDLSGQLSTNNNCLKEESDLFLNNLNKINQLFGLHKCLFGSDWPFSNQKKYVQIIKKMKISKKEKDLILWKNAKNIFNL